MPSVEFRQQLYPLRHGENLLGATSQASVPLPDLPDGCVLAISVESSGSFVWAPSGGAIAVNGRPLGNEPIPLFHGDRIAIEDSTLVFPMTFIDDGSQSPAGMERAERRKAPAAVAAPSTDATSRTAEVEPDLISRVTQPKPEMRMIGTLRRTDNDDVYVIHGSSFRIGREKQCDVVIPEASVYRLHAEITLSGRTYYLRHVGRTETKLNGKPLTDRHPLGTGDIIQIGNREFAFVLRRTTAEDIGPGAVTPVRGAVPDAPTELPRGRGKGDSAAGGESGGRAFTYVLLVLLIALLGLIAFG